MISEPELFEQIRTCLPPYLSPEQKQDLFLELKGFPENFNYYLRSHEETYLQGDGWRGFVVINFHTKKSKEVSGVILSNTCDIAVENSGARDRSILFTPLIPLESYKTRLQAAGKSPQDIENIVRSIQRQRITTIFYLPPIPDVLPESILLLDNVFSHPLDDFHAKESKDRFFVLSQYGFYMFVIKLSIHFTRFQETVARYPAS